MIKLLSWNIQAGGGSRLASIAKYLVKFDAHIVTLNEFRNNTSGIRLRGLLLKAGYRYQAVTHSKSNDNSVAIISKIPFDSVLHPNSDANYSGNIISAKFPAFHLLGVYMPHKKKHTLFNYVSKLKEKSSLPLIVAGDYNSGENYIDQKGNSFWYTSELKVLMKQGMIDAFRHKHGDVKEYSWFSHQGNGYRYDHIYVDKSLQPIVSNCYYLHDWRLEKLSDHSPMVLEMG